MTRSPTEHAVSGGAAVTSPVTSCPGVNGRVGEYAYVPLHIITSGSDTAAASTRTVRLVGVGDRWGDVDERQRVRGSPWSVTCQARTGRR